MINLTKKAECRFNIQWHNLQQREGDFWKLDVFMMGRIPMLLLVHEYTLNYIEMTVNNTLFSYLSEKKTKITLRRLMLWNCSNRENYRIQPW
jgi:hypothetical protein